jgi:cysteine desulfurase
MLREIYFDNSATTRPYDEVIEYINYINRNIYGNPSSLHSKGIEAEKLMKKSREIIASALGAESREIYFTSGGTESNNLAIRGYLNANLRKGKHIITTKIEHPSVLEVFKNMSEYGFKTDYLNVDNKGSIDIKELKEKINKETALISIIYVNNEVGSIQPIEEIVKIKNTINRDICLHVDAVQAYGKSRIMPSKTGIDMLSVSAHKIHGPKGVGALYVNKTIKIKPVLFGGGQEALLRSGTENLTGICGFGLATEMIYNSLDKNNEKVSSLKSLFLEQLRDNIDSYKIISPENSSPYILNISFDRVKAEVLLHHLEEKNIYVSTGSACSSRKRIQSYVLKALGLNQSEIDGAIRFSFSAFNTEVDVTDAVNAIKEILPRIRIRHGGKK